MEDRSDLSDILYAGLSPTEHPEVAEVIDQAGVEKLHRKLGQGETTDLGEILDLRRTGLQDWATDLSGRENAASMKTPTPDQLDAFADEHDALADARDRLAAAQDAAADDRDLISEDADVNASMRDRSRTADRSETVAQGAAGFLDRFSAGVDRDRGAGDRSSAIADRRHAADDRSSSAADRSRAADARKVAALIRSVSDGS